MVPKMVIPCLYYKYYKYDNNIDFLVDFTVIHDEGLSR